MLQSSTTIQIGQNPLQLDCKEVASRSSISAIKCPNLKNNLSGKKLSTNLNHEKVKNNFNR